MKKALLLGCKGCGNVIVESALAAAGMPFDYEEVDYAPGSATRDRLLSVNPLGQVPALVLPDGTVLTESLAMLHYVDDLAPQAGLIPPRGHPARGDFYRWAVFFVAAIYPTFTYGDDTSKWVANPEGAKQLRESTNRHREGLWRQAEAAARSPWFLGEEMTALDLYIAPMTYWRPGRKWFAANAPKLFAIAEKTAATPKVAAVFAKHF
ncbi:MAG: glutathione S-transferase family protein [Usitatibacter sp.]